MDNIVLVEGVRTAIGTFGGSLKQYQSSDLAVIAVRGLLDKTGIDPELIDEVVMGCCGQHSINQYAARIAAVKAGIPLVSTALMVNRQCASGLQAIISAAIAVDHNDISVAIAGGCESMTNYPYSINKARWGYRMGHDILEDLLITGLTDPFNGYHMGVTAENVAAKYNISREDQDAYALSSQKRARKAIDEGKFVNEIIPVEIKTGKTTSIFKIDENPHDTSLEKLAALPTTFKKDGTVTAGNAAGINDAGAAALIMNGVKAKDLGFKPKLRIIDYAVFGVPPELMGEGPIGATKKLLQKTGIKKGDIGLIEINEAFAAQTLACIRELGLNENIVNVNGSGISLGHPVGATGCIITIKLANEMRRRGIRYGMSSLCIGGGQGMSVLFELID